MDNRGRREAYIDEVQRRIEKYIRFYNEERVQKKLKKPTPVEYRRQLAS
jgi:putative transposase